MLIVRERAIARDLLCAHALPCNGAGSLPGALEHLETRARAWAANMTASSTSSRATTLDVYTQRSDTHGLSARFVHRPGTSSPGSQ